MEFRDKDNTLVQKRNDVKFGQIQLNVSKGRLYEAWDDSMSDEIEGIKLEGGHVTKGI